MELQGSDRPAGLLQTVIATSEVETAATRAGALALLAVAVGVGAALRVAAAILDRGIYWPDEIYETLEPAHWLVFGYGLRPWEYIQGAHNWALSGLIGGVFKLSQLVGLGQPSAYLTITRLLFALVGVLTVLATFRLARTLGASRLAAAVGATACALWAPMVYFAPRALSETASTLPVVLGLSLALPAHADRRARVLGTALLGAAVLLRLQSALFCVALVAVWVARRNLKVAAEITLVLLASATALGFIDWLTWGGWFQSAAVYLRFNLSSGPEVWGTQGIGYYLLTLLRLPGLVGLVLLPLAVIGGVRSRALLGVAALFLVSHSLASHKELRFILPAIPIICALAALGLDQLRRATPGFVFPAAAVLVFGTASYSAATLPDLTFGDIGAYLDSRPQASAWDDSGPINRLMISAGQQGDLCGLRIYGPSLPWTGGYTFLNRRVPLYGIDKPPATPDYYNYAIVHDPVGFAAVRTDEKWALIRTATAGCAPDQGYDWRLP